MKISNSIEKFENYIAAKNDEIDNCAWNLLKSLNSVSEDKVCSQLEWNQEIIAPLIEYAENLLKLHKKSVCHPFYEDDAISQPCYTGFSCLRNDCQLRNKAQIMAVNVNYEYETFKKNVLESDKNEIFDNYYKIRFFYELSDYLLNNDSQDEERFSILAELSCTRNLLQIMYDYYLKCEYSSIENWSEIDNFICNFINYEQGFKHNRGILK